MVILFLHQQTYTIDLISDALISDGMTETILLPVSIVIEADNFAPYVDASHCHLVGKLIYLCHTQPDLSYAVSLVIRFMHSTQKCTG